MRKNINRPISALLLIFFFFACAQKPPDIDITAGVDPRALLNEIKLSQESVKSVKGIAAVTIIYPDMKLSFNQTTIAEEPNLAYIQAQAPFGKTALTLISDGSKIYLISPKDRRTFNSLDEFNLASIYPGFPSNITVENLINLLLGRIPVSPAYESAEVKLSADSDYFILTVKDTQGETAIWIDPATKRVQKSKLTFSQGGEITSEYKDFVEIAPGGGAFPSRIELASGEFFISVSYNKDVQLNAQIDRSLYQPPGKKGKGKKKSVS